MLYQTLDEPGNNDPLYSKTQTVFVKRLSSEEKPRELNLYVASSVSKVSKQSLFVQVTDEEDPYLLYSLLLTEEDYASLKSVQGLLVDFYNFPHDLVRLFEECRKDGKQSKFLLMLEEDAKGDMTDNKKTYLKVVEANNFKHLCHLQLQVTPGTDNDIMKLMLNKIKILKEVNSRKEGSISQLNAQVLHLSGELNKKSEELNHIQQKCNDDKLAYKVESAREINEETEKLRKAQAERLSKMELEKKDMELKYFSSIKDKEEEISKLRIDNQILIDKRNNMDSLVKDQLKQIEHLEKELNNVKWDLSSMRKQCTKLDSDYHEKEKTVNSLKTKLAGFEQEIKDKVVTINKLEELLNACNDKKSHLEEVILEKEKLLIKNKVSLQNITSDLMKANEIIAKFYKDITAANSKLKVRTCVVLEQEKVIESNKLKISELESKLSDKEISYKTLLESESNLKSKIADLEEIIMTKDTLLKDNERLIEWLNKRIDNARETMLPNWTQSAPLSSTPYSMPNDIHESPPNITENTEKHSDTKSPLVVNETPLSSASINVKKKVTASKDSKKPPFKPAGFKRVSFPYQVSTVPSSYFDK